MQFTAEQVMTMMQEAGVPCGLLETAEDLLNDPQLKHRGHFRVLQHREIGEMSVNTPAYWLSKTPCHIWKAGPCIGEDNEYVLKKLLGYTDDDIADLLAEGALTTEADTYAQ
jgi:benzylsuccinate CoA-transferase BbsF subunit